MGKFEKVAKNVLKKVELAVTQVLFSRLLKSNEHRMLKRTKFLSTQYLKIAFLAYNLQRQNRRGMKAPIAMKTGNITEESSMEYGSGVRGPLVCLFRTIVSSSSSCIP